MGQINSGTFGGAHPLMRPVWVAFGVASLGLGAIGVLLPVLPTTPFVILAAFAFGRSSPRLAAYLETHPVFGKIIDDWRTHGAIARRYKTTAIAMMGAASSASIAFALPPIILAVQALCLSAAALFIVTRPGTAS